MNKTIFDRFAKDTNISLEDLGTFEGIARASARYYEWTDNQTPSIKNDGKMFFMPDSLFNFLSINTIKTHTRRIYSKLNISSREELLLYIDMLKEAGKEFK